MRASRLMVAMAALVFAMAGPAQAAGDVAAGMAKAKSCAACHGADGKGKKDNPALAGKPVSEFIQAMQDYESRKRKNGMMNRLAKRLSDEDIANLAAYYASLK